MKKIITYGTFDVFHVGHVRLLRKLKELGDYLIVAVSTDEFNAKKGKRALIPYCHRVEMVESCRYVDMVIPEKDWNQKSSDINNYGVDVFGIGDDWAGKFDELNSLCKVVYLERTKDISSSMIKSGILKDA